GPNPSSPRLHLLLFFLLLLASSGLSYEIGDFRQCRVAPFVPGYNLVGESLDMVTFERKGVHPVDIFTAMSPFRTCFLYRNPHQGNQLQKMLPLGLPWSNTGGLFRPYIKTFQTTPQTLQIHSVYCSTCIWSIFPKIPPDMFGLNVGGEHYDSYDYAKSRNREDQYTFSSHWHRCSFYRHTVRAKPLLDKDFEEDMKNLPRYYNSATKDKYRKFIRTYGTHYIYQVTLGGQVKRVAATRTCLSKLNSVSASESRWCLSLDLEVGLGMARLNPSCSNFLKNRGIRGYYYAGLYEQDTEVTGGNGWSGWVSNEYPDSEGYRQWKESLKGIPVIVKFFVKPLHDLVNDEARSGLVDAINEYTRDTDITVSVLQRSCRRPTHHSNCCPKRLGKGWLTVTIVRAWVRKQQRYRRRGDGHHIHILIKFHFPIFYLLQVDIGQKLKLELKDDDSIWQELLLSCSWDVTVGSYTLTCRGFRGTFEAKYELLCGPHLTGDDCDIYEPY
uniref:MACPF domain-containing protein n=1 Tax=Sphaeramia orbicularis TaxID=375764 RepID=A0A673BGA4_9TELE